MQTYRIKDNPEDFVVEEIPIEFQKDENGKYTIMKIRLKNWENNHFVSHLSDILHISRKRIGFAGTKDKRAITTQYFSIYGTFSPENIKIKDCDIIECFRTRKGLDLGDLKGNKFIIKVYSEGVDDFSQYNQINSHIVEHGGYWNYFGIQRFGAFRNNTHKVGEKLLKYGYEEAVKEYLYSPGIDTEEYRLTLAEDWNFKNAAGKFPKTLQYENALINEMINSGDYERAFKSLPQSLRMMFIHAYQSKLFNEIIEKRAEMSEANQVFTGDYVSPIDDHFNIDENKIIEVNEFNLNKINEMSLKDKVVVVMPLVGSDYKNQKGVPGEIVSDVLLKNGVKPDMFKNNTSDDAKSLGTFRSIRFKPLQFKAEKNGVFHFELGRGSYATVLLDQIFR
ncbi:tRNA pseudouridine(13) synthase TruD [Caldiplasma sukawensis]